MPVLVLVEDVLFQQKIEATAEALGVTVRFSTDVTAAGSPCAGEPWTLVLVDLGLTRGDALALVAALRQRLPATPIIGYGSHVDAALLARGRASGCTDVMARSAFVRRLADLLSGSADHA